MLKYERTQKLCQEGDVAVSHPGSEVPAEWGGGSFVDGGSQINVSAVLPADIDEETGLPFSYRSWPSYQALVETLLSTDWKAEMGGAPTTMDYVKDNDQLLVATGASCTHAD
jgi:multiple sugar transport system substrate-binding protein/putative aldouronate transport system substrate-binding protein